MHFGAYSYLRDVCLAASEQGRLSPLAAFCVGSGASLAATASVYPLSVLKTKMQAYSCDVGMTLGDMLTRTLESTGVRGLYQGWHALHAPPACLRSRTKRAKPNEHMIGFLVFFLG